MQYFSAKQISTRYEITPKTIRVRASKLKIIPFVEKGINYYSEIELPLILNYLLITEKPPVIKENPLKNEVLAFFKYSENNSAELISRALKISVVTVHNILNRHFKNAVDEMTAEYITLESRINWDNTI